MVDAEPHRCSHILQPLLHGLLRQVIHQINPDVLEARLLRFLQHLEGPPGIMAHPQMMPHLVIEGLDADADPVRPLGADGLHFLQRQGCRTALERDLRIRRHPVIRLDTL